MLVIAHRGYHELHPENTLAAFAAACELGVDGIETDLRLTSDGHLALMHDRLVPDGRPVGAVTLADLCAAVGYEVPAAAAALDAFPDVLWNLEIKTPEALPASLALIESYRTTRRLFVTSFWHEIVDDVAKRLDVECGLLVCHGPTHVFAPQEGEPAAGQGRVTSIVWCYEFLDERIAAQAKGAGYRNFVYGVATPAEHWQCAAWGLDGIITDRPEFVPDAS